MKMFIPIALLALFAAAQGSAIGQIEDVAFELEGQEYHLTPLERQVRQDDFEDVDGVGGKRPPPVQCKTIDLPATLSLKVCGCRNPGCPHCPCNDYDGKDDKKNKPKTREHYAPRWSNLRH